MGTPAYMSPEQARGEIRALDRRSDVYSLGATLYDLVAGAPPFDAESVVDVLLQVVGSDPMPLRKRMPSVPPDLDTIVMKCLNKEPHLRYDSAKAMADDLGRYLDGEAIHGQRLSLATQVRRRVHKNRTLVAVSLVSFVVVLIMSIGALRQRFADQRERQRLATQARVEQELAQRLGEEITKMEWLLRSARQLPLHDLEREKAIVRGRMDALQLELKQAGEFTRGLAHYALGRGHLALHEYPQALRELRLATALGYDHADVQYALGFVLGKHYEQAMYEARLAGGGDWAKKQLKEIEPRYLLPAIDSLQRSRSMKLDAPQYLEGLIAYYQRDYHTALSQAAAALKQAPWLYEAHKLAGDVHLERALQARDSGHYEAAEREFASAVQSFSEAATIGQSDGEIYEGLAESWVRQIETATNRSQPTEAAYAAAVAASDKLSTAEPASTAGPLKRGFAALMTMGLMSSGLASSRRVQQCLDSAKTVLEKLPGHPYASDLAAGCYAFSADAAIGKGIDPEPLFQKGIALLEPAVKRFPHFLWGINDLGNTYGAYGAYLQIHGKPAAKQYLQKALGYFSMAAALDATYVTALQNKLGTRRDLIAIARSEDELRALLSDADNDFLKCTLINNQWQQCYNNMFIIYAKAAWRTHAAGVDPRPRLSRALQNLAATRKFGGTFLDTEQHAALAHLVDAEARVQSHQDPGLPLAELQAALRRCFAIASEDAMCRTVAVQGKWLESAWQALQHQPSLPTLRQAVEMAQAATASPETHPEVWRVLAESQLRLARAEKGPAVLRHLSDGLEAAHRIFLVNRDHALGHATRGELLLLRAEKEPAARREDAERARAELELAVATDPILQSGYAPLLARARVLAQR